MTKEEIESLRAKLNNPDYINKACFEIGTRFTEIWEKTGYSTTKSIKNVNRKQLKNRKHDNLYRDAENKTVDELAKEHGMPTHTVRSYLRRKGIIPKSWSYKDEEKAKEKLKKE